MALAIGCRICKNTLFNTYKQDPDSRQPVLAKETDAMMTPCGHTFHSHCLTHWMSGTNVKGGICPNCSKPISNEKCISLFLDSFDETMDEPAYTDALRHQLKVVNENYVECQGKSHDYEEQVQKMTKSIEAMSMDNSELKNQLEKEKVKSEQFLLKYKGALGFKAVAEQKQNELANAEEKLQKHTYFKDMLNGVKYESEDDVATSSKFEASVESLLQLKYLLTLELDTLKKANKKDQKKSRDDRIEKLMLLENIEGLEKGIKDLKIRSEPNPKDLLAPTGSHGNGASAAVKPKTDLNGTINLSSDEEEAAGTSSVPSPRE